MAIQKIDDWDWPDSHREPDGYDWTMVPDLTVANFKLMAEKINEIIDVINDET